MAHALSPSISPPAGHPRLHGRAQEYVQARRSRQPAGGVASMIADDRTGRPTMTETHDVLASVRTALHGESRAFARRREPSTLISPTGN
jgi:hypothetical protein